jgi:hypothetical protein
MILIYFNFLSILFLSHKENNDNLFFHNNNIFETSLDQVPPEYRSQLFNVFVELQTLLRNPNSLRIIETETHFAIGSFSIEKGPHLNKVFDFIDLIFDELLQGIRHRPFLLLHLIRYISLTLLQLTFIFFSFHFSTEGKEWLYF